MILSKEEEKKLEEHLQKTLFDESLVMHYLTNEDAKLAIWGYLKAAGEI